MIEGRDAAVDLEDPVLAMMMVLLLTMEEYPGLVLSLEPWVVRPSRYHASALRGAIYR